MFLAVFIYQLNVLGKLCFKCLPGSLRFYLLNTGTIRPNSTIDWSLYEKYTADKNMDNVFRSWLEWVKATQPETEQVLSRKVVGIKGEQAAQCSAKSVATHFDALEKLFVDIGVLTTPGGKLQNPQRVWAADEKAMVDDNGKLKFVRSLSIKSLGPPTCNAGSSSFRHISVLPFVCLDGRVSEPYITVAGQSEMNAWSAVWPGAHIKATEQLGSDLGSFFVLFPCFSCIFTN